MTAKAVTKAKGCIMGNAVPIPDFEAKAKTKGRDVIRVIVEEGILARSESGISLTVGCPYRANNERF